MPAFAAITLDRLLEPGASKSATNKPEPRLDRRNSTPLSIESSKPLTSSRRFDVPPPHPKLTRRNTTSFTVRPQISPALYATPESTPLPDSPTSFPPSSPYIINHKRRGPRLSKSFSEQKQEKSEGKLVGGHSRSFSEENVSLQVKEEEQMVVNLAKNGHLGDTEVETNRSFDGVTDANLGEDGIENGDIGELKVGFGSSSERDGEVEDFFDLQESMSFTDNNTDGEDCSGERSGKLNTPMGEFFDAWEELSSESGRQSQHFAHDIEEEFREMRLSLLMEIEKRKQAEEALNNMRSQWQMVRQKLGEVGVVLPVDPTTSSEDGQPDVDPAEEICRQVHLARFVSESIGRGIAKAEAEAEMEAQLELKNFEIARLCDRLHYYEAMNREMSQRNQEAIEVGRRERQKKRMRQRWVWGSVAAAITLGGAALAWSYVPTAKVSSSDTHLEPNDNVE